MTQENIDHLERALVQLEEKTRDTRRLIARFRQAEMLHQETTLLAPGAKATLANELNNRATAIRDAYQHLTSTYAVQTPIKEE